MKKLRILTVGLILLLVAGCSDDAELKAKNDAAFKACIESGGVPLQVWFNEKVLGDCVYKPVGN